MEKSASQEQYEAMISYFKWIVTTSLAALTLISAVGLGWFYKNISEVRAEAKEQVEAARESAKAQISAIRDEAARRSVRFIAIRPRYLRFSSQPGFTSRRCS